MTPDYYVSLMKVYSRFVLNMNPSAAEPEPDAQDRRGSWHAGH